MNKKEFEKLIRKTKSANMDEELKLRQLSDIYCKFLKSPYREDAMKMVKRFVLDKYQDEIPPVELHKLFLESAKYYIENEMYTEANNVLDIISDSKNINVSMQARVDRDLIKVKQATEDGEIDQDALDDIQKIVVHDDEHELDTAKQGRFTEYDVLTSYFADLPVEETNSEIFPPNMIKPGKDRIPNPEPGPIIPRNTQYIEELSAEKRLEFIKNHFPIERVRVGKSKFTGTIIFEIKDSDLVIAESFFKTDKDGNCVEDYGKATYIIPKEAELDLIELSRGELREKVGKERIESARHDSEKWYEYLVERFNNLQSKEYEKIELDTTETHEVDQIDSSQDANSQERNNDIPVVPEDSLQEGKADNKEKIRLANESFINGINENIGNILSPQIVTGMLNKASYSFENLYNQKLKEEILERLEILEVPEEQREIEAQKVFIYMKMTKQMSMINARIINGNRLDNILDNSAIEYEKAFEFLEEHKDDELSYSEMVKAMKQFMENKKITLKTGEVGNEEQESKLDLSDVNEENAEQQEEQPYEGLMSDEVQEPKRTKAMDMAIKFENIMERYKQIESKIERANTLYAEKLEEYSKAVQETANAKEAEEKAKQATKQALSQEEFARKEMQDAQDSAEELKKEQEELKAKIDQIEELLQ